jgi:hypothetical protein
MAILICFLENYSRHKYIRKFCFSVLPKNGSPPKRTLHSLLVNEKQFLESIPWKKLSSGSFYDHALGKNLMRWFDQFPL